MAEQVKTDNVNTLHPDLGVSGETITGLVKILSTVLADEYVLYTKLRKYHWNVTGPHFFMLHEAFEDQYTALEEYIDDTAERIRQFGVVSPGTLEEFKALTRLTEQPGENPDAYTMVANLVADHEAMVRNLREDCDTVDDDYEEIGVEDYLTGLLQAHQKHAWMLRSLIEGQTAL